MTHKNPAEDIKQDKYTYTVDFEVGTEVVLKDKVHTYLNACKDISEFSIFEIKGIHITENGTLYSITDGVNTKYRSSDLVRVSRLRDYIHDYINKRLNLYLGRTL